MEKINPLISVIIPVYNTEKYLIECLDSVIKQTYTNLEIILVNDGSTDMSGELCDIYKQKDSRIIVIHQDNQGVSEARNTGICISSGEYIMFIDSDDWVDDDICEVLTEQLFETKANLAMCSYSREYPNKSLTKEIVHKDTLFKGETIRRRLCGPIDEELKHPENIECFNMMCGKLYPAKAIKEKRVINLDSIGTSEDLLYNFEVFKSIESMIYVNEPLYHYRKAIGSSITSVYKPNLSQQWDKLYDKMFGVIEREQLGEKYIFALNNRIAISLLGIGLNCVQSPTSFKEKFRMLKKALENTKRNEALKQLSLKYMPLHWKLFYLFAKKKNTTLVYMLLIIITNLKGKV